MSKDEKHEHCFVPVAIEWKKAWSYTTDGKTKWGYRYQGPDYRNPLNIILACSCGIIKRKKVTGSD